jgi:hypothetical protein
MMTYWQIFWRTFAQLALAGVLALQGLDFTDLANVEANAFSIGVVVLAAGIGGLVAVLWAFVQSPADSALEKGLRSAAETIAGGLGALAINTGTDWVSTSRLIVGMLGAAAVAFLVTYFQYQQARSTTVATSE